MPLPLALALGGVLALAAALLLRRCAPALAPGVGLVLLLVATLRALGDAATLVGAGLSDGLVATPGTALLVLGGLGAGAGSWLLVGGRPAVAGPVGALAVVLAQAPLLAAYATGLPSAGRAEQVTTLLLAGGLATGAVLAAGPRREVAACSVVVLAGAALLAEHVDPLLLRAPSCGLALGVLVPLLLARAQAASGARLGVGALAGVVLVLLAAAAPALVGSSAGVPRRYGDDLGLQVVSDEQYAVLTSLAPGAQLVPGLSLLSPGGEALPSVRIAG